MKLSAQDLFEYIDFENVLNGTKSQYPNLVGFYECNVLNKKHIPESIDLFMSEFSELLNGAELYSTATNFPTRSWSSLEKEKAQKLRAIGWFEFDRKEEDIEKNFSIEVLSKEKIISLKDLFELTLSGMTDGYVFIFIRKIELVVYPHKYQGFGFMANGDTKGYQISIDFLKQTELHNNLFLVGYL